MRIEILAIIIVLVLGTAIIYASTLNKTTKIVAQIPKWVENASLNDFNLFLSYVNSYFKNDEIEFVEDFSIVHLKNKRVGTSNYGLENLLRGCLNSPKSEWEENIKNHFEQLEKSEKEEENLKKIIGDFDKIQKYIAVKFYTLDYINNIGLKNVICQNIVDDIYKVLVFDLPVSVRNVKPDEIEGWNKNVDELFEIAEKNTISQINYEVGEDKIGKSKIFEIYGDSIFIPTLLINNTLVEKYKGKYGIVCSFPNSRNILLMPIDNMDVIKDIQTFAYVTNRMYNTNPGAITDKIFWHNGKLINLKYKLLEEKFEFEPPKDFIEMLNSIKE